VRVEEDFGQAEARQLLDLLSDLVTAAEGIGCELEGISRVLAGEPRSAAADDKASGEAGPSGPPWVNGGEDA
jgi:hypothetical protein